MATTRERATLDVLISSVLFAGCNIAWRFGSGPALGIIGIRVAAGAAIATFIGRRQGAGSWRAPMRVASGRRAVIVSVFGLIAAGTMFRALDGPLAGLAVACVPAVALLVRDRSGRWATGAALGSSMVAVLGLVAATGGVGRDSVSWSAAIFAVFFVALEVGSLRTSEVAVSEGLNPTAVVTASMVVAAVLLLPFTFVLNVLHDPGALWGAAGAALAVALFGTVGRVLRTAALPAAGITAVAASSQVAALFTALGGIVLVGDVVSGVSLVATLVAAGLGAAAVVLATRWRLARRPELAAALDAADMLGDHRDGRL